jgi:hypothetical protein
MSSTKLGIRSGTGAAPNMESTPSRSASSSRGTQKTPIRYENGESLGQYKRHSTFLLHVLLIALVEQFVPKATLLCFKKFNHLLY